jgi:chromatin segregation and condensation protein Rec8/ScpA/Scc1 (kleisin family)
MKAKTFENLLRKIIREEIDYSLRRELKSLKEDLRDELKPTIVEHTERIVEVPEATKQSLRDKIMGNAPIKQRPEQNFTSNSTLNALLNETAQGDTNTQTAMAPSITETANMPDPVAKAITRDYSDLMKAISKKKGR